MFLCSKYFFLSFFLFVFKLLTEYLSEMALHFFDQIFRCLSVPFDDSFYETFCNFLTATIESYFIKSFVLIL